MIGARATLKDDLRPVPAPTCRVSCVVDVGELAVVRARGAERPVHTIEGVTVARLNLRVRG